MSDNSAGAPPRRRRKPPTTPDPIEIALEAQAEGEAPEGPALAVLTKTARLLDWQIASERFGAILKGLTGVAGVAVAAIVALIAWDASRYHGLIVQPFSTPPDMVADGLTGQVLAGRVLDALSAMQTQRMGDAYSFSEASAYSAA